MSGIFWTDTDNGLFVFVLLTILGAAAAMATGRALAKGWSPVWLILPAMAVLSAAVRFLHFSLFQEDLASLHYYLVTLAILLVVAWIAYKSMRAQQMATQYSWAYEKVGLNWRPR
jgi:hypothetical protein